MCCTGAKWKREIVQDHKFDFVDIHEYHTTGAFTRLRYSLVYVFVIKSVLVYVSDIYTAVAMLANGYWSGNILAEADSSNTIKVPFTIGRWIFTGCIIFSFLLLAWEGRKARMIIRSRDISYAFTNVMANNYYTLKSYDHFCFFSQINNSKKKKDEFAFFVFFTFKGWKRLLLADAPRQVINALTLYSFGKAFHFTTDISKYYNDSDGKFSLIRAGVLCTMIFTVVIWCGSAILLAIAALMYIPLLCYIQGNLKEYCCHKIDKRIAELMKRKTKKRLAREAEFAKREAAGDYRHLQDKKGRFKDGHAPLPQPTLPSINLDDEEFCAKSEVSSFRNGGKGDYSYPPMPTLPEHAYSHQPSNGGLKGHPNYAYSDSGMSGNESSYALAHAKAQMPFQGYGYPPHNDSTTSFGVMNDDKASIKSRDPLLRVETASTPYSLTRAPSYRTREDDDGVGSTYDFGRAYQPSAHEGESDSRALQDYYEPDSKDVYPEPPYAMQGHAEYFDQPTHQYPQEAHQQYGYPSQPQRSQQRTSQFDMYDVSSRTPPRTQSPSMYTSPQYSQYQPGQAQSAPVNFNSNSTPNPLARGLSVTGRSEVNTFYYNEHRDRASVADSHAGAFDLDDYARNSMFTQATPSTHNPYSAQRGSRLDYLGEEELDEAEQRHNQQDWRR